MKLEGTRSFEASRGTVWEVLNSPQQMAEIMPGVESFDIIDDRHWRANVKIPLGLGGMRMSINFEKLEENEPDFAKLHAKGTGVGALMDMETAFHLEEGGGGGTDMRWEADVRIAGPVGSMGQRVLQPIVNQQVQNVLAALDRQVMQATGKGPEVVVSKEEPAPATPEAEPGAAPGSSAAEEGIHPGSPEAYEPEPEGPTRSTED
jgi:carbon monoxide dehydrogenase subunit G